MQYRILGRTNLKVSSIGFGTWAMGGNMWGPQDDNEALSALSRAWELGCNFYDTAAVYGDGHSEELLCKFMKSTGNKPIIATKVPPKNYQWPAKKKTPIKEAFPKDHIISETEGSLKRLGIDCVDIQQLHVWAEEWTDIDEWYDALLKLQKDGKIRFFGISLNTFEPDDGIRAVESGWIDTVQVVHNIFEQAPEDNLFPAVKKNNVGIIDRVPFDESALTGKLKKDIVFDKDDFRNWYFKDSLEETVERVEALSWLVPEYAGSLAEAALRYCLSHGAVSTVIPGIRNIKQAEENLSASDKDSLNNSTLLRLKEHRWNRTR